MSLKTFALGLWLGLSGFALAVPAAAQTATPENGTGDDGAAPRDVILVLDNSGSMKKNDPRFLTGAAVKEFVSSLQRQTRLGILLFDQDVELVMPLTPVNERSRERVADSIERIDYKGLFTDSPAAIERAIYELKNNSRQEAQKFIVFMTDGIVDTGNTDKDLEKTRWLREDLAPDAADAGIRIFGIAFTEDADFQLIQSLAQKTDGEYYRVLKPEDLRSVFERVQTLMQEPPPQELAEPEPAQQAAPPVQPPQPVVINVPERPVQTMDEQERIRSMIIIASAVVLIVALVVIIVLLVRHNRGGDDDSAPVAEAYLNDIHGHTSQTSYRLGSKPVMLGRVAGKDTEHLDYIVIPQSTIGRRHALIEYKDFAYWIVDQGSINGTYVNDMPISSEVRLKHGDRIRLHKLEFEFVMPEMEDESMTELSSTVFASQGGGMHDEATALRGGAAGGNGMDLDLDISAGDEAEQAADEEEEDLMRESGAGAASDYGDEDETLMPGDASESETEEASTARDEESEDATLMPGDESEQETEEAPSNRHDETEDVTLMPGEFDLPDEDETLRSRTPEESVEDFFDLTETDDEEENDKD